MNRTPRWLILSLLVAVISINIIDRQIIAILAEPIKRDLSLTDTQLGLLTGLAFSLFYSLVGLPIAQFADRGDRVRLLAAATFAWSLMTGLGGAAVGYVTLLLARAGVAVGEAGCNPTTQSLLADYFPPEKRGFAQGVLVTAIPISSLLALAIGGLVAERLGWRWTLVTVAIPGLLLAPLILRLLPEPRRGGTPASTAAGPGMWKDLAGLLRVRALVLLLAAATFASIQSYAMLLWAPSLFIRSFGWSLAAAGVWLGLAVGVGGVIGSLIAGRLADRLRSRGAGAQILISAVVAGATVPILLVMLGATRAEIAIGAFFVLQAVSVASSPALYAALQDFAPPANRALAFALLSLCANLVGMGLGPVLLGAFSDALQPAHGDQSLRLAMLVCVPTQALAALFYGLTFRIAARSHRDGAAQ
ncbi:MAG: MFS transporter [Erythrobacter sp.]|uniref:spinster family MFS transporter n=1 Tax=Erythrobacter sp. TaxID=1042 RepID=UPI0025D6856D|nr:MFS transporter [Erythrobacter sp.]MCL9999043.1 MFS transporter [Erythrobacter sp.]